MQTNELGNETIGERIRRFRKERGLNQNELAEMVGVTFAWISQIEQDKANASPSLLHKIALAFKIPVSKLLQNQEQYMDLVSRLKLGEILLETNQADVALEILKELCGHPDLSDVESYRLEILFAEYRYQKTDYEQSLDILKTLIHSLEAVNYHDAHILAEIHNNMGKSNFQMRDFSNAYYHYRKAYEYSFRFPEFDLLTAKINYNLGTTLRRIGRAKESIAYLNRAYRYFKDNENLKALGYTILEQGIAFKNIKDYTRAAECFEQSKAIFKSLEIKTLLAVAQHIMASEVTVQRDSGLALKELEECVTLAKEDDDYPHQVLFYSKIASIQINTAKLDDAINSLQNAVEIISEHSLEKTPDAAECYRVFARYHFELEDYMVAIEYALKSADIFGTIGLIIDQVDSLQIAIAANKKIGNLEESLSLSQLSTLLLLKMNQGGSV